MGSPTMDPDLPVLVPTQSSIDEHQMSMGGGGYHHVVISNERTEEDSSSSVDNYLDYFASSGDEYGRKEPKCRHSRHRRRCKRDGDGAGI